MGMGMVKASNRLDETTTKDVEGYLAHVMKEEEKKAGKNQEEDAKDDEYEKKAGTNHEEEEDEHEKVGSAGQHEDEVVELLESADHSASAGNRSDPDPPSKYMIAWDSSCVVVKLQDGGLFLYAPAVTDEDTLKELRRELGKLGEVKLVFAYAAHTTGVVRFQQVFPDAVYFSDAVWVGYGMEQRCPKFRMDFILPPTSSTTDLDEAGSDGSITSTGAPSSALASLQLEFDWHYGAHQTTYFFHRSSGTLIGGDLLVYKTCNSGAGGAPPGKGFSCSCAAGGCDGPGGAHQPAATPAWHAMALQQAFFDPAVEADNLLPTYGALPGGAVAWPPDQAATALAKFQEWRPQRLACLHVPPLEGEEKVTKVLQSTFGWAVKKSKLSESVGVANQGPSFLSLSFTSVL
eukprot:g19506.t1